MRPRKESRRLVLCGRRTMALRTLLSTALLVPHVASNGCCFESESFWDDLDDATATPRGAASHPDALLPRLCPRPAAAALGPEPGFARCMAGEASALHLLLHVNKRASWQRLIPMPPQHASASHYLNHLPALASLRLIHSRRIRIFYCVPPGWQGHSVSKSTLSRVDCAHDTDMFFELGRGWADAMADWPQPPKGLMSRPQGPHWKLWRAVKTSDACTYSSGREHVA